MSNTVYLRAATGETEHVKSLSTADRAAEKLYDRLLDKWGFEVPILHHDIDYPLVKHCTGTTGLGPSVWHSYYTPAPEITAAMRRIVGWGGSVYFVVRTGSVNQFERETLGHYRWSLPLHVDPDAIIQAERALRVLS